MKPFLLYEAHDFHWTRAAPWGHQVLTQDLDLATLLDDMSGNDQYLRDVAARVILAGLDDPAAIRYRQRVLRDCLAHPAVIRQLYQLAADTVDGEKKIYHFAFSNSSTAILQRSIEVLEFLRGRLQELRVIAQTNAAGFASDGFAALFDMLTDHLSDDYLDAVADHLNRLRFRSGVFISAQLGTGNHGRNYVLRTPYSAVRAQPVATVHRRMVHSPAHVGDP